MLYGKYTIQVVDSKTGNLCRVYDDTNIIPAQTITEIVENRNVFSLDNVVVGISSYDIKPSYFNNILTGQHRFARTIEATYNPAPTTDPGTKTKGNYGLIKAILLPTDNETQGLEGRTIFLALRSEVYKPGSELPYKQPLKVLAYSLLRTPVLQTTTEILELYYQIQLIDYSTNSEYLVSKPFVPKLGKYLFSTQNIDDIDLFSMGKTYTHVLNPTYDNLLVDKVQSNQLELEANNSRIRYKVTSNVLDKQEYGSIYGSLTFGLDRVESFFDYENSYELFHFDNSIFSELSDFQATLFQLPNSDRPLIVDADVNIAGSSELRRQGIVRSNDINFDGTWLFEDWPELYRINIVKEGLLVAETSGLGVARYKFSYRNHLGFDGNTYINSLVTIPYLSHNAYPGIHLLNKFKLNNTELVCWDLEGISVIDLITGNHIDLEFAVVIPTLEDEELVRSVSKLSNDELIVNTSNKTYIVDIREQTSSFLNSGTQPITFLDSENQLRTIDENGISITNPTDLESTTYSRRISADVLDDTEKFFENTPIRDFCRRNFIRTYGVLNIVAPNTSLSLDPIDTEFLEPTVNATKPLNKIVAIVVKSSNSTARILWLDLSDNSTYGGPELDFSRTIHTFPFLRNDWIVYTNPGRIGTLLYQSTWLVVDGTGTYKLTPKTTDKELLVPPSDSLNSICLFNNEPFIFTRTGIVDTLGRNLEDYSSSRISYIEDEQAYVIHLKGGICVLATYGDTRRPTYLLCLGTGDNPAGLPVTSFAFNKIWRHYSWDEPNQSWYQDLVPERSNFNSEDNSKQIHADLEPLIKGIDIEFRTRIDANPVQIIRAQPTITAICFTELPIDAVEVINANEYKWEQLTGTFVALGNDDTLTPTLIRTGTSREGEVSAIFRLTATNTISQESIVLDFELFVTPTSRADGYSSNSYSADKECKKVPCDIRSFTEQSPAIQSLQGGLCIRNNDPNLRRVTWFSPTCGQSFIQSYTWERNIAGNYVPQVTIPASQLRVTDLSVEIGTQRNFYRVRTNFNTYGRLSSSLSCTFDLSKLFVSIQTSIDDNCNGYSIGSIGQVDRQARNVLSVSALDTVDGFSINAVGSTLRQARGQITLSVEGDTVDGFGTSVTSMSARIDRSTIVVG